jgi:hypothetical protein
MQNKARPRAMGVHHETTLPAELGPRVIPRYVTVHGGAENGRGIAILAAVPSALLAV